MKKRRKKKIGKKNRKQQQQTQKVEVPTASSYRIGICWHYNHPVDCSTARTGLFCFWTNYICKNQFSEVGKGDMYGYYEILRISKTLQNKDEVKMTQVTYPAFSEVQVCVTVYFWIFDLFLSNLEAEMTLTDASKKSLSQKQPQQRPPTHIYVNLKLYLFGFIKLCSQRLKSNQEFWYLIYTAYPGFLKHFQRYE